jgi:tetratricopeptide (TPR) repeat protein
MVSDGSSKVVALGGEPAGWPQWPNWAKGACAKGSQPLGSQARMQSRSNMPMTLQLSRQMTSHPVGVSACLIVRDEERVLSACLKSIRPWVEEICVVDTGSRDGSAEIARAYGARIESFEWCDDFAAARNRSIEMARHAWILVLDADELFESECGPELRGAVARIDALAFAVTLLDVHGDGSTTVLPAVRLFRNDARIRFDMPVHESVMDSLIALGGSLPETIGVRILHKGYLPEVLARVDKLSRNGAILRKLVKDRPTEVFAWFKYAQTLARPKELGERLEAFRHAWQLAERMNDRERRQRPFLPQVYDGLAETLERATALGEAIEVAEQGLVLFPGNAELLYRRADLALRAGDFAHAERSYSACLGASDSAVLYGRVVGLYELWVTLGRARIAFATGDHVKAQELVARAISEHPGDLQARCLQIEHMLATGAIEESLAAFRSMQSTHDVGASRMLMMAGDLAWRQGDVLGAQAHWKQGCVSQEIGYLSRCRIAMATWVTANASPRDLLSIVQVRDLQSCACALLLAIAADLDPIFDPAYCVDHVAEHTRQWVDGFVRSRNEEAHRQLLRNASSRLALLPGLVQSIV